MDFKKNLLGTVLGGVLLLITSFVIGFITAAVAPYDIFAIGGMRSIDDPIMILFFLYPVIVAFASAVLFEFVKSSLKGSEMKKGITFGLLLFLIITIPSAWVIYTSMTYPLGFHLDNILQGLVGYSLLGIMFVKIWAK